MARPRKEKYEIGEGYLVQALQLSESLADWTIERKSIFRALEQEIKYTEEMAIAELSGGAVSYDSERVQTSNIANLPERITILLMNGYVEKRIKKMEQERKELYGKYLEICAEIEIVENAKNRRMDDRTRKVFEQLYEKKLPWSKICDEYGRKMNPNQITRARDAAILAIAEELQLRAYTKKQEG